MEQRLMDSSFVVTADHILVVRGSCKSVKMERVEVRKGDQK